MNSICVTLFTLVVMLPCFLCHPEGAPMEACQTMMPQHDGNGKDKSEPMNELPYLLLAESNCYQADQIINVTVYSLVEKCASIEGVFIQAKESDVQTANHGTWDTQGSRDLKHLPCFGNAEGAVTHNKELHGVRKVALKWTAPASNVGTIDITATILWHKKTFWTDVKAQIIYDANCAGETPTSAIPEESAICGANIHTAGVLLLTLQLIAFYVFALA